MNADPIDDIVVRRDALMLAGHAVDGLDALAEAIGGDPVPFLLRALAAELVYVGLHVVEIEAKVAELEGVADLNAALVGGLLGAEHPVTDNTTADVARLKGKLHSDGRAIRKAAGLT